MMARRILLIGMLVLGCAALATGAGTEGHVDVGFGSDGVATLAAEGSIMQVLGQADGKLLTVGSGPSGSVIEGTETRAWFVHRLLGDGESDPGFGANGVAQLFGDAPGTTDEARAIHLDADGNIWVAGRAKYASGTSGKGKKKTTTYSGGAFVVRLDQHGEIDADFGIGGEARLSPAMASVQALVPLQNGDVLVVGRGEIATPGSGGGGKGKGKNGGGGSTSIGIVVACLNADGSLETTYGEGGFSRTDLDPTSNADYPTLHGASLQSDGSLVLLTTLSGDTGSPRVGLVRLTSNGMRDAAFAAPLPGIYLRSMAVDDQDRILVAGYFAGDLYVQRFDEDGALDASYGTNGEVHLDTSGAAYQTEPLGGHALILDGTGLLLACIEWIDENAPVDGIHSFAVKLDGDGDVVGGYGPHGNGQSERLEALPSFDATRLPGGDLAFGGHSYASATLGAQAAGRLCGN